MKIEIMIYAYIAICVSMIAFNIVYIFILRHREKTLAKNNIWFKQIISEQLKRIKCQNMVLESHKMFLEKSLQKISNITAFDKALESAFESEPGLCEEYLKQTFCVFESLTYKYIGKDTIKIAYFPYILQKYNILKQDKDGNLKDILLELLRSVNVYCRENTLKAIYSMQRSKIVVDALKIIDTNLSFHHPKLVCDGLLSYKGDRLELKEMLFKNFGGYSVSMQVNILNFLRFGGVECTKEMLDILTNEKANRELRFCAIRYFEKFPKSEAKEAIWDIAENTTGRTWEYQAIASSALKSYPGDVSFRILIANLSSSNWHVRHNSAVSLEKLGYTYHDLISVFDGNDRYAREIMRYYLDKRNAEKEASKI